MSEPRRNHARTRADRPEGARAAALEIIVEVVEHNAFSNLSNDAILRRFRLDARDRAFATALVYGTISRMVTLDHVLNGVSSMPLKKMDEPVRNILRMGAWQLMYARAVPARAACNESVSLASRVSNRGAAGMVNGILRRIASHPPEITDTDFSLYHSLPSWLGSRLIEWLGRPAADLVAEACNVPPPLSIRVNRLRTDSAGLAASLKKEGVESFPGAFHPDALRIELAGRPVTSLAAFAEGLFMVQDEAAMLVSTVAATQPGQTVLDLCAAPGGKSCHMAEMMGDRGRILACDLHPSRLDLIGQNAGRLGLTCIDTRVLDATEASSPDTTLPMADLVLCDVPCSGLGLLARKPDIRLHADPDTLGALVETQRRILQAASERVRPGGTLVYSTCTLNPEENSRQTDAFLAEQGGRFTADGFAGLLPPGLAVRDAAVAGAAADGRIQLLPGVHGCDGFYISRFRRIS